MIRERFIAPSSMDKKNKVTILLTQYGDPFSKFIKLMSRCEFTHASICIDEDEEIFYSFNLKGFVEEHWKTRKSKYLLPKRLYIRFYVTDEELRKLRDNIERFKARKHELSYSAVGTVLSLLRIPSSFKTKYFCSRFIAEILHNSGVYKLKRKASLYLPIHFMKEFR